MKHHRFDKFTGQICVDCGGFGKALTTDCPNRRINAQLLALIHVGQVDYVNGTWINVPNYRTTDVQPTLGRLATG